MKFQHYGQRTIAQIAARANARQTARSRANLSPSYIGSVEDIPAPHRGRILWTSAVSHAKDSSQA